MLGNLAIIIAFFLYIFSISDFYTVNEVDFNWHRLGLAIDASVQEQLADFNFRLIKYNNTRCPCKNCFPGTNDQKLWILVL